MGGLVSSLGFGPGGSTGEAGTKFAAEGTDLINPFTDVGQLKTAYDYSQQALAQQQNFVNALQAQNGIANQNAIYNQLGNIAAGQGPNPAQAMLAQQTANNISNQAALMAGQRGAGANAGLLARQAAQQGGALQQQAVGQGATLQAQQALNALAQQGGIAGQQVGNLANATMGFNQAAQSEQQNLLNAAASLNQQRTAMRANQNTANAGIANTVAQGQQGLAGGVLGGIGSAIGGLFHKGGKVGYQQGGSLPNPKKDEDEKAKIGKQLQQDPNNPIVKQLQKVFPSFADGGQMPTSEQWYQYMTQKQGEMPTSDQNAAMYGAPDATQPKSNVGKFELFGSAPSQQNATQAQPASSPNTSQQPGMAGAGQAIGNIAGKGISAIAGLFAQGGKVPALVSPGEIYLDPEQAKQVAKGKADPKEVGSKIPGKAKVKGDSLKNDTVAASLDSGGIVIPRSKVNGSDEDIIKFVRAVQAKSALKHKKD